MTTAVARGIMVGFLLWTFPAAPAVAESSWFDAYYQYRIPVTLTVEAAGWHTIPLNESAIIEAINAIEPMQYDERFFAYNALRLVTLDEAGRELGELEGGFHLVRGRRELATDVAGRAAADGTVRVPVTPDRYHLLTYTSSGGGRSPAVHYEPIWPPDSPRHAGYRITYEPPLLPQPRTERQVLFVPNDDQMTLLVGGPHIGRLHQLSVREAQVRLMVHLPRPGTHRLMLYHQPMCGHHLQLPRLRADRIPDRAAVLNEAAAAEKHIGVTQHRLAETDDLLLSFAQSTVKVTRDLPIPEQSVPRIGISLAAREAQSFQLLLTPRRDTAVEAVTVREPERDGHGLAAKVSMVEYVTIHRSSDITPARYLGDIGDPLLPVQPRELSPRTGHQAYWITVRAKPGTPAGIYTGEVVVHLADRRVAVPLDVKVYDFELPEYSAFKSNLGGQYFAKEMWEGKKTVLDYHGLASAEDLRELTRRYFDLMLDHRFTPKSAAIYESIGMNWSPPPQGYNVDAPGNWFELKDWDFTQFNDAMRRAIDEKKMNTVCILHTNPTASNIFIHLPGEKLDAPSRTPPFTAHGWQTYRRMTHVSYDPPPEGNDSIIQVTRAQWDDLVLKFFRRIAENLEEHGWLDRAHILVDETEHSDRLEHLLSLLKSDPLTARIQVVACVQGLGLLTETVEHAHGSNPYRFHSLIDTYCPEVDENYDRWMDYYFDDYGLERRRSRVWFYAVSTARLAIDAPGVNNRMIGLDVFRRGGSGYLVWETVAWDHLYGDSANPWQDPWTRHANGSLAYFYPPCRTGPCEEPDWTITPSLRVETYRESAEDFDYAWLLEQAVARAEAQGRDASEAHRVLADINRFFEGNVHWSQNDAWYLDLRDRMARSIVALQSILSASDAMDNENGMPGGTRQEP